MSSEMGDLINFSNSPPLSPVTPRSTSSFHARVLGESGWQALKPDKWSTGSWTKIKSPAPADGSDTKEKGSEKVDGKVKEDDDTSTSSSNKQSKAPISIPNGLNEHKSPVTNNNPIHHQDHHSTPKSVSGKNIPLPDSPYTPNRNDSDARSITSITSDETTQSKLSANAKPFSATPQKRIPVIKTSEPPSFFPSPPEDQDHVVQTPDVSPDQMDPGYFEPGYGGHLTTNSSAGGGLKSPVWFAPPPTRRISITTPETQVKVEKEERPATPVTVKTYDGTADSPISDRNMREHTPRSPSQASSDLPHSDPVAYYEGEDEEPRPLGLPNTDRSSGVESIDHITAHFGSISLTPADGPVSVPPHHHPSSEGTSASINTAPNPYDVKDGLLSPQHTGDRSSKAESTENPDSNSVDIGQDTTLVSDGQFDFTGSVEEVNDLEDAWMKFRDGYGQFSGSIDEALARLKMELAW
jgi:hypothetical protein